MQQPMQNLEDISDPTTIVENMNGLSVVLEIKNQYGNRNVFIAAAEGNGNSINDASEETERVKVNCILENNLQLASTSNTQFDKAPVYDSDESAKENEFAKLWNDWYKKCEECKYDKTSYDKAYNDMQQKIERLQARLGDQKGKSKNTPCVSNTLDPLPQKLENESVELEFQVSEQKDTTRGTSANTKFTKQSILGKPPSSFRPKLYAVTPLPKYMTFPKVGIFRMNSFKASRVDNFVPNKHVKASVMTKPITVLQPHVITKNDVNSKTNGFSPKDVKSTTKTRRPLPRNNPKNDKIWKVYCLTNYSNGENQVVSKSFAITTADASDKRQQQQDSTSSTSTLATTITVDGNFDL
uniref:Uncharacterized protein n=1 Tax=Tanacetum cinerariifolium TaxID=118510 RepID=A0A699HE50_TANCI|nr:hypothetical protein [Tanacetum cinerariifolium]